MRAIVVGAGAVGSRIARQLVSEAGLEHLAVVDDDARRLDAVVASLGSPAEAARWSPALFANADVAVLACPGDHRRLAEAALEHAAHVVSIADGVAEVRALLRLDAEARERHLSVVCGAGFAPGLSCVLARHAAADLDTVDEVHIAKAGTGGPACARQRHRSLTANAIDWRGGAWVERKGGSGRELCWFPDPIGGRDCYRAGLPDAILVGPAFPDAQRVTARTAATRRDRLTMALPMLRRPHPEGLLGAIRVEVRGTRGSGREVRVLGAIDRPAVATAAVAAVAATWAVEERLARPGAAGLAELVEDPVPFLHQLAQRGVRAASFVGVAG